MARIGALSAKGLSSCPTRDYVFVHRQLYMMTIGTKQGISQLKDICTKYGFCEEVVYKLMGQANLNHNNAN